MKLGGGSEIVENNRSRRQVEKRKKRKSGKYSTIDCKVVTAFIIIFRMCRREGV